MALAEDQSRHWPRTSRPERHMFLDITLERQGLTLAAQCWALERAIIASSRRVVVATDPGPTIGTAHGSAGSSSSRRLTQASSAVAPTTRSSTSTHSRTPGSAATAGSYDADADCVKTHRDSPDRSRDPRFRVTGRPRKNIGGYEIPSTRLFPGWPGAASK